MNGPDHYAEAERLLATVLGEAGQLIPDGDADARVIAAAQVHATLAHASTTAVFVEADPDTGAPIALHADPDWRTTLGYEVLRYDGGYTR